jgi:hypothetical protein
MISYFSIWKNNKHEHIFKKLESRDQHYFLEITH